MKQRISAIMVIYNEESLIPRALKSITGVVDEIIIFHDGPCRDNSIKICKKYTKNVFETKTNVGLPGPILPHLLRKAKGPWILKIDADELLSKELKANVLELVKNNDADAYTFKWPFWSNGKPITKNWPRKMALYRKSRASLLGFPHWDDPTIKGNIIETNYILEHRPLSNFPPTWEYFKEKVLYRYARLQAEYTIKDFNELDSFQYSKKDFPVYFKIRRRYLLYHRFP